MGGVRGAGAARARVSVAARARGAALLRVAALVRAAVVALVLCGVAPLAGAVAAAQDANAAARAAAQPLPTGDELLERYRAKVNAAAFRTKTSMHSTGAFSMPAAGITGTLDVWSARPSRTALRVDVDGYGAVQTGFTDGHGWTANPSEPARLMEGAEALQARDDAAFDSYIRDAALLTSATSVERTQVGGEECVRVRLVWKSGRETFDCYSTATGLVIASRHAQAGGDAVSVYGDYRETDGVLLPMRIMVQVGGVEQVLMLSSVRFDTVTDAMLAPPASVRALIDAVK